MSNYKLFKWFQTLLHIGNIIDIKLISFMCFSKNYCRNCTLILNWFHLPEKLHDFRLIALLRDILIDYWSLEWIIGFVFLLMFFS